MPRLTQLNQVLFPVEEHPVFVSLKDPSGEQRLSVPGKKAIVNRTNNRVLGIVSLGYRLVSNREALSMAQQCCRTVFPETKSSEWEVTATDAPATAGYCHIDLVHNSTSLDFSYVPAAGTARCVWPVHPSDQQFQRSAGAGVRHRVLPQGVQERDDSS